MMIRNMFAEDINRQINGVIKVDQDTTDVIEQEVREYVITKELKKHFISFFDYYSDSFDKPTDDIGVWISGFFGSGKSHFLKMLSYILENKSVGGVPTVEMFRKKFADDPATFMLIDKATRGKTETILFNIDIEGSINKDKTAVLRVFAKMFYNHLGFFGENLKVAMLEQYIDQLGKTEEFRRVFEAKKGKSWVDQRKAFAFNGKFIIPTLMEVLDMSEEDAKRWFNDKTAVEFSIAQLVEDIKAYVKKQPKDFRLIFLIDEVGQYVGTDTDMLLNLQSLTEKIGSECGGKVWVMCTGQEAIDEIIKVRADEFSRIQARFKTRLSLSSSSVDEVIQKRILKKKPDVEKQLEGLYQENDSVLRNLFSFTDSILDIKGFTGANEFAVNFPFVPYQFIIMQKVFAEIRKHGNSGKHLSGGERSMLSGFQEAAQKIQNQDEYALVPFFRFYDTVHTFLDSSIRRVIERCQNAADIGAGIEAMDVDVLKLLYLIRYVDDIPANVDNIVILMADDIRTDKIVLCENVRESLNRLMSQNYIGRTGDTYNFLTDEEQDIQKDIKNTNVDTASIVERIAQMIYADIYQTKKYRYGKYDFDFDKMVDGVTTGAVTGGMKLRFLTVATDAVEKSELRLMTESKGQAIVVLSGTSYYEALESAMKIRKFVKQRNVSQLPKSMQDIIRDQQDEAGRYELSAMEDLKKAIVNAAFYVDGEHISITSGDAKSRIDQALEYLVAHVYSELGLIGKNAETDADIIEILTGNFIAGAEPNRDAAAKVEEYLIVQDKDVTVRKADLGRDIRSFISYAVGCMFGRYSLDVDGLAYAGGEWDAGKYASFAADKNNIIPICDDEYFEDDIVGLFVKFVKTVYGVDTLDENLKFIADALGGKGQPKDVIRNYFLNDFYSDHCKMYQKRPIYWLFDSGKKNGFKALIYMHRYQPDTIARMRTDYVHEQQGRYRTAIADLESRIANADTGSRVKLTKQLTKLQNQAEELRVYEEKIHHLADQMIRIDLDDGVKRNYAIFQDVLAKIK